MKNGTIGSSDLWATTSPVTGGPILTSTANRQNLMTEKSSKDVGKAAYCWGASGEPCRHRIWEASTALGAHHIMSIQMSLQLCQSHVSAHFSDYLQNLNPRAAPKNSTSAPSPCTHKVMHVLTLRTQQKEPQINERQLTLGCGCGGGPLKTLWMSVEYASQRRPWETSSNYPLACVLQETLKMI